jgi:hypothetical protein
MLGYGVDICGKVVVRSMVLLMLMCAYNSESAACTAMWGLQNNVVAYVRVLRLMLHLEKFPLGCFQALSVMPWLGEGDLGDGGF